MDKTEIRKEMLAKRAKLTPEEIADASTKVLKNLFADMEFLKCSEVGFYHSCNGEIDTTRMIERALLFGKTVYLPKMVPNGMEFCEFTDFENLVKGKYGIPEPQGTEVGKPEMLIVPGVAFDLEKHRLGFGKGYYDKYLHAHEIIAIGVCYAWQVVDKLPRHEHDKQMNKIIAEDWILE